MTFEDYKGLWLGDEDSCGYAHPDLVTEMCRLLKPKIPAWDTLTLEKLVKVIYGNDTVISELNDVVQKELVAGFREWEKNPTPQKLELTAAAV